MVKKSKTNVKVMDVLKNAEMKIRKEKTKKAEKLVIKSLNRLEKAKRIVKKLEEMHQKLLNKDFLDIDIDDYKYDEADEFLDNDYEDEE